MEKPLPAEGRQRSSGVLLMSARERERSYRMRQLANKAISPGEAAVLLNISTRQCHRLYKRWQAFGDSGLVSGCRGRASNNRQDEGELHQLVQRLASSWSHPSKARERLFS